jgi:hypothetical protein
VRAVDGRFSVAGALEARLRDGDARARQLGGLEALVLVARGPEKPIIRIAAAALARLLDAVAGESPASSLETLLSLLPGVEGSLLEEVACSVDGALSGSGSNAECRCDCGAWAWRVPGGQTSAVLARPATDSAVTAGPAHSPRRSAPRWARRWRIQREHALLLPAGRRLPFAPKGPAFHIRWPT